MRTSKRHDDHGGATEVLWDSGQPLCWEPVTEAIGCYTRCCLASWQLAQGWEERTAHVCAYVQSGKPWSWRSGERLCPADDVDTAAEKIAHVLAPLSDPGVMGIRRKAGA